MPTNLTDRVNGALGSLAFKAPVVVATAAAITISGLQTIAGVVLAEGDRVLVKDQTDAAENGIYVASSSEWQRAKDFDGNRDIVKGSLVRVNSSGITYTVASEDPVYIGSSDINFSPAVFSSSVEINVADAPYYASCNGIDDDTAAIQAALNDAPEYSTIFISGVCVISGTLTVPRDNITIKGPAKIIAKAGTSFEYMMLATSRSKVVYEKLEFDANQTNRVGVQAHRFMGAGFLSCTDCEMLVCKARNTLGYGGIPAVGLFAAGGGIRCKIFGATLEDCGGTSGTDASDGIFTSGWNNLISHCTAANCTDTAFVIESSNFSIIEGCTASNCAAGGAITNATADACYGNQINGLSIFNWDASNTGGIQIGVPTATAGDLINTVLSGVAMYAETGLSKGDGAAINIRNAGSGKARGVTIVAPAIRGSRNQGILVDGEEVTITAPRIRDTTDACIQFQSGTDHVVNGGLLRGGSFGVASNGSSEVQVQCVTFKSTVGTSVYAFGTSTIDALMNIIKSPSVARYGKDGGATLNVVTAEGNNLSINNQRAGTAGSGSVAGSFLVYDATGNTLGYVDYKPT